MKANSTAAPSSLVEATGLRAPVLSPATGGGATAGESPLGEAAVPRATAPSVGSGLSYADGLPLRVPPFMMTTGTAAHASLGETTGLRAPVLSPATADGATAFGSPVSEAPVPRASAPIVGSGRLTRLRWRHWGAPRTFIGDWWTLWEASAHASLGEATSPRGVGDSERG